ncbi:NADH-quinone oxidoreductase subunit J [Methanolobus sp.]|jgi:NADH:ubiquinone oxidoreductase subunit 6 (subunit J)|uniref:NADH-quinone oxidoreductase subunit J n=1 Tax=Methanolobus sp. TaxID=1874737 RepID=UPI0026008EBB|nr:NADH-quinone oxidoreductase subunit J [Methanolobus sp.]
MDTTIGSIIEMIIFAILALASIVFALFVVTAKDVVRAAIALVVTMFIVAALYILLNAQFLGVIQVLVYIGAIGVLILFAVMLTKKEFGTDAE